MFRSAERWVIQAADLILSIITLMNHETTKPETCTKAHESSTGAIRHTPVDLSPLQEIFLEIKFVSSHQEAWLQNLSSRPLCYNVSLNVLLLRCAKEHTVHKGFQSVPLM